MNRMEPTELFRRFIHEHAGDDLPRLLLGASRYPGVDVPFAVEQIAARRQIREKLPSWYENDALMFPAKLAAEQCSSEATALYKQRLVAAGDTVCDLTGGLGIDSYFFSRKVKSVIYIERFPAYCEAARHNFAVLGATNIQVKEGDSTQMAGEWPSADIFYIDPARRGEGDRRVYALSDCEPDLPRLLPELWRHAPKVIAKLSPMADLQQTLRLLPETVAIHVLSVKNECKELLFVLERGKTVSPHIDCVHVRSDGREETFSFSIEEENAAVCPFAPSVSTFLYEPNASILKAGAFKSVAMRFELEKLHVNSHLYTSDRLVEAFPGRIFRVEQVYPFQSKTLKTLSRDLWQSNITVRNFPLSVDELRKRTKIKEGGEDYLFATTLSDHSRVLIRCVKPPLFPASPDTL